MTYIDEALRTLDKRVAHLTARIERGEADGRDLSFDKQERKILRYLIAHLRDCPTPEAGRKVST